MTERKEVTCKRKMRFAWWLVLLITGIIYICNNYSNIIISPNTIDIIIILAFMIIIFMPLVSEITMFGMSIKKEIEDSKKEIKNEISGMRLEFMQYKLSNSQCNDITIGIGDKYLPSRENIKKDIEHEDVDKPSDLDKNTEMEDLFETISYEQIFLFKSRYVIECKLIGVANLFNINEHRSTYKIAEILYKSELIDITVFEYIKKVSSICNRGIHGEIVDDEYIEYVKKILPKILDGLKLAMKKVENYTMCICTRCGYRGLAKFSNVCPNCGYVTDDD